MYSTASPLTKIDRQLPKIEGNNYNAAKPKTRLLITLEGLTGSKPSRNRGFFELEDISVPPEVEVPNLDDTIAGMVKARLINQGIIV
jgi:hypothetical protein